MVTSRIILRISIYALLLLTFFLGLPQVHYASALMIAILIRHKDEAQGIFGPVNSTEISLPLFTQGPRAAHLTHLPKAPLANQKSDSQNTNKRRDH